MNAKKLLELFVKANKRAILLGSEQYGVVIGLDLEGRLFYVYNSEVVSTVNEDAILGCSSRYEYKNPGGDGLWPAPEGTKFGYQYATTSWSVPTGILNARFMVIEESPNAITIEAEVPLINAQMLGIPTIFRRHITLVEGEKMSVEVVEEIEYIGRKTLATGEFLLAPWSLCQFDWQDGDYLYFEGDKETKVRDLYTSSIDYREIKAKHHICRPSNEKRYQIALGEDVKEIHLKLASKNLQISRYCEKINQDGSFIDIADSPIETEPTADGVKYSFYSDPSKFLEIEAAGCCYETLNSATKLMVKIVTEIICD